MIKPGDLAKNVNVERFIHEIDEEIIRNHGDYPWETAIIGSLPMDTRNTIAMKYVNEGGWKYVYHITSSENGERGGLTNFKFSMTPIDCVPKNSTLVTAEGITKI